jgi:lysophospholipase L1-like esterase
MSYTFWSGDPYSAVAGRARDVSLGTLRRINRLCVNHGIKLGIAAIPYMEQVYSRDEKGENYDIRLPQRYLEEVCEKENSPYLDLLPLLRRETRVGRRTLYAPGDPHLNNEGHTVLGEALADWLRRLLEREGSDSQA